MRKILKAISYEHNNDVKNIRFYFMLFDAFRTTCNNDFVFI